MNITPDSEILWQANFFKINLTLVMTWIVMAVLVIVSYVITHRKKSSRQETSLEVIVETIEQQLQESGLKQPRRYLGFIATLFFFIVFSGLLGIVPGFVPPTSSLSTTVALSLCVFIAVPFYAIREKGFFGFLKNYAHPSIFLLPLTLLGEITRTIALSVRLFGNMMSGTLIVAIIISVFPLFFSIFLNLLGLITSVVQAYIFTVLAIVYIAAATRTFEEGS
jgi:F-type H+-transporting ATPase subunit a